MRLRARMALVLLSMALGLGTGASAQAFTPRALEPGDTGTAIRCAKILTMDDEDRIFERSSLIQTAIDARQQRFPGEEPYRYQPFVGLESQYRFDEAARERIRDYDLNDLGI